MDPDELSHLLVDVEGRGALGGVEAARRSEDSRVAASLKTVWSSAGCNGRPHAGQNLLWPATLA
jgi:hypothetical protein